MHRTPHSKSNHYRCQADKLEARNPLTTISAQADNRPPANDESGESLFSGQNTAVSALDCRHAVFSV